MSLSRKILIAIVLALVCYFVSASIFSNIKANGLNELFHDEHPYDLVIRHATILDGTGQREKYRGDIAIYEGKIVEVGTVGLTNAPVFDAGGLTVIPIPVPFSANENALEHAFSTSYPRFAAEDIYLQNEPYTGNNLEQVAEDLGLSVGEAHETLKRVLGPTAKAYITHIPVQTESTTMEEYLARLTCYRANYSNKIGQGVIKEGADANLYFFLSKDYDEAALTELFKKGKVPEPLFTVRDGVFVNE
ncbi:MAG: hypothetical protein WAO24_00780 [Peptococcia bacterium]